MAAKSSYWSRIPRPVKWGGGLLFSWVMYRKISREIQVQRARADFQLDQRNTQNEMNQWTQAGDKLTYPQGQYSIMADSMEEALDGPWYDPTDEDTVYDIVGMLRSNSDFLKLKQVFGMRQKRTMTQWMRSDLDQEEVQKVNSLLAGNNIVYQI